MCYHAFVKVAYIKRLFLTGTFGGIIFDFHEVQCVYVFCIRGFRVVFELLVHVSLLKIRPGTFLWVRGRVV